MNKLIKLFALITIVLSMLTIGCGPSKEEQYNTLKQETLKMAQEVYDLYKKPIENETRRNFSGIYTEEFRRKSLEIGIKEFKEANNAAIEKMPAIEKNVAKMKDLTKDNVKLTNDCNETIKEIKQMTYDRIEDQSIKNWGNNPLGIPKDYKTIEPKF